MKRLANEWSESRITEATVECSNCLADLSNIAQERLVLPLRDMGRSCLNPLFVEYQFCSPGCFLNMILLLEDDKYTDMIMESVVRFYQSKFPSEAFEIQPLSSRRNEVGGDDRSDAAQPATRRTRTDDVFRSKVLIETMQE